MIGDYMDRKKEIVKMLLNEKIYKEDEEELLNVLMSNPIAVDIDKKAENNLTFGEKIADKISSIVGSWLFIFIFLTFLAFWIILNVIVLKDKQIDPYPFILLNLALSCISAIQAPIIMMSQNREAKKDSLRNQNDYKIDLKSELILEDLHDKIVLLLKNQKKILEIYEKDNHL